MPAGPVRPPRPREPRPFGMSAPAAGAAEVERRGRGVSRLPLVLGAATGIVFCALALAALFVINGQATSPAAAGQALCAELQAQQYDAMYTQLAPSLQGAGTQAQFAATQRELDALSGKVVSCAATVQHADGSQASLRLTITRERTGTAQATVHMQLLDGAWKVDAYDTSVV